MNATLMSPWKGLNWRRRASILCRRFCAQNAQKEAGTGGPGLQWFAGGTPLGCRRLSKAESAGGGYPVSPLFLGALDMLAKVEAFATDLGRDAPDRDRLGVRQLPAQRRGG